jgi:hypothetical protein
MALLWNSVRVVLVAVIVVTAALEHLPTAGFPTQKSCTHIPTSDSTPSTRCKSRMR